MRRRARPEDRSLTIALALASALAAAACADDPGPSAVTVTDSAGVTVVTNAPGALDAAEAWSLSSEPAVEIGGGADPDVPLYRVSSVRPLDDGRVAVGMNAPATAVVFDAEGRIAAEYGGAGEGPGEFSSVGSMVPLTGDSMAVWDPDRRRLSIFDTGGRFAREVDLSERVPVSPLAAPSTALPAAFTSVWPTDDGALVVFAVGVWGPGGDEAGAHRTGATSHRIDAEGRGLATYGPFPGLEMYTTPGIGWAPYPFGRNTYGAISGDRLVVGTAEAPEVRVFASDGSLERIVRWEDLGRPLEGSPELAAFEAWFDEQLAPRDPAEQEMLRGIVDGMTPPERLPPYGGIVSDLETGEIWVGAYPGQLGLLGLTSESRPLPARRWLVFDTDGALVATVQVPERFDPRAVRHGALWGVYRDELDVESVRAYEVRRSSDAM